MKALTGSASSRSVPLTRLTKVDDMAVILHLLIEIHLYIVAVAGEVVAGKVHRHRVFGVLLGSSCRSPGIEGILLCIADCFVVAMGSDRHGGLRCGNGFRGRAENAEASEVEIEQMRRRVDAAQGW